MDNNNQDDFQAALATEFDFTPDEPVKPAPDADDKDDEVKTPSANEEPAKPAKPAKPAEPTTPAEPAAKPQDGEPEKKIETAEEIANREGKEDVQEAPKPLTQDDIRAAVRDVTTESQQRIEQRSTVQEEIIKTAYPEGLDTKVYDSDGKVIETAQDIVDRGLINERTGEPYTYEQAASFMLEANRKMAENVAKVNSWAETVAEENISLQEGNYRVMQEFGEILKAMPNLAKELANTYVETQLEWDAKGNYITKMHMKPEDFYRLAVAPYKQVGQQMADKKAAEAEAAKAAEAEKKQQEQDEQNERLGLPAQRGASHQKANTGDPMLDALVDELDKG